MTFLLSLEPGSAPSGCSSLPAGPWVSCRSAQGSSRPLVGDGTPRWSRLRCGCCPPSSLAFPLTGRRDLALLDVVDCRDLLRYPAGGPGLPSFTVLLIALRPPASMACTSATSCRRFFDLDGYAAARHGCHLLQGKRKKPPGFLWLPTAFSRYRCSVAGRVSSDGLPALSGCPAVFRHGTV